MKRFTSAAPRFRLLAGLVVLVLVGGAFLRANWQGSAGSRPVTKPTVVWAVGDAADRAGRGRKLAELIAAERPDLFLYLGDVYESGTAEEFTSYYEPLYGRLASRTAPTPGNHEWGRRHEGYFPYWRAKRGTKLRSYYALRRSGWEIISLNSTDRHEAGSSQHTWLRRKLRHRTSCRLAFMHRPRFSAGVVHGDEPDLAALWNEFPGRVRVGLAGHEHNSQRLATHRGVVPLVAGGGGSLYPLKEDDPRLIFGDDEHYAGLRMVLTPKRMRYAFVGDDGQVLHRGAVRCR